MNSSLVRMFSLRRDQQGTDVIDEALRNGAQAAGTNLWLLFLAILIASVGLNVNPTAVIIGAMLISPLMGPIVGMGYGAAVADFGLIRTAFKNLALFSALSLVTSVVSFALSPLDHPGSELLARTSPTLWDVLIAAFGGAAGMVAVTRKSFSNIVPGVAIAMSTLAVAKLLRLLALRHAGDDLLNVRALRKDLGEELQRTPVAQVRQTVAKVLELEQKAGHCSSAPASIPGALPGRWRLADEIRAQLPQVQAACFAQPLDSSGNRPGAPAIVVVDVPRSLNAGDRIRLSRWLAVRLDRDEVTVIDRLTPGGARR